VLLFSPENLTLFIWKSRKFCVTLYDTPNSTFYTTKKQNSFLLFCFFYILYPTFKKVGIICPLFEISGFFVFLFGYAFFHVGEIVTANPIIGDNIKTPFVLVKNHTEALKFLFHTTKPLFQPPAVGSKFIFNTQR
jgi:hypothetical protein